MPEDPMLIELPELPGGLGPELTGGLAPLRREAESDGPFESDGSLPPSIDGLLAMIGPNPITAVADPDEGDGMVHGLGLESGRPGVQRSRFVRSLGFVRRLEAKAPPGPIALGGPRANRRLAHVAGRLLALDGAGYGYRIDPTMGTAAVEDFDGMLMTAMGSDLVVHADGSSSFLSWPTAGSPGLLLHEMTGRGVISSTTRLAVDLQPDDPPIELLGDLVAIACSSLHLDRRELGDDDEPLRGLQLDPDRGMRLGLVQRGLPEARAHWCTGPVGSVSELLALSATGTGADGVGLVHRPARSGDPSWRPSRSGGVLTSLSADARTRSLRMEALDDVELAGAAVDRSAAADLRRHAYGVTADRRSIVKYNVRSGGAQRFDLDEGLEVGHPLFWRDPEGRNDEEGWLMLLAFDASRQRSLLLVFDATRIASGPEGSIALAGRIPLSVRPTFLPGISSR